MEQANVGCLPKSKRQARGVRLYLASEEALIKDANNGNIKNKNVKTLMADFQKNSRSSFVYLQPQKDKETN